MPAQKRNSSSSDNLPYDEDSPPPPPPPPPPQQQLQQQHHRRKQSKREREAEDEEGDSERDDDEEEEQEEDDEGEDEDEDDSDDSRSSDDPGKLPEWILVELPALRTYVQCPICLGIIKKTRTVMECLHRFCRECIDKSMRLGNNECPACRTHCASRRSLRDDPRFDALIEILYEDIERYEDEELAFHEDEENRNKQIQASIAQIFQRQSEALVTRGKKPKGKALSYKYRDSYSRRRRNTRGASREGSEDNEDENNDDRNKDSSEDDRGTEIKHRRYKRKAGAQSSQPSPSAANVDGGIENDLEASRGSKDNSYGPMRTPEMLAWGGGGARSRIVRNTRIMKLAKYLESLKENDELDVHLILTSLDKQRLPSLQQLYLCCSPQFSVDCLKKYVAQETLLPMEDIEILLVKDHLNSNGQQFSLVPPTFMDNKGVLRILDEKETLAALRENCDPKQNHLILAYRMKEKQ